MNFTFTEEQAPFRIRFEHPVSDEALLRFSFESSPLRFERDSNGELIVMMPAHSKGGATEGDVLAELVIWLAPTAAARPSVRTPASLSLTPPSVLPTHPGSASLAGTPSPTSSSKATLPICPEFVIEVRSRTDRLREIEAKMETWIARRR